ncbi:8883_t:CDS:2 [Scutellospora calospora]|uniref:8883_t:CDS:1 n=1 Tax=Scutellospora calospora TaxID=85575 RepID=A0ACA9MDG6_9GLOM|nr:8883_t:CDS:2 [Scutellospora calospora]
MLYNSFKGHLEDSVKKKFRDNGIDLAVIPSGLTSICQPLDVAINKLFKDNLRKEWYLWIAKGGAGKTAAGNLQRARISDVCDISNDLNNTNSDRLEDSDNKYKNNNIEIIDISKDDKIIDIDEDDEIIDIDDDDEIIDIIDISNDMEIIDISDDNEVMDISDNSEIIDISNN